MRPSVFYVLSAVFLVIGLYPWIQSGRPNLAFIGLALFAAGAGFVFRRKREVGGQK